ncbi:hypothetical protein GCM10022241_21810 [Micrococcus endophyticus]
MPAMYSHAPQYPLSPGNRNAVNPDNIRAGARANTQGVPLKCPSALFNRLDKPQDATEIIIEVTANPREKDECRSPVQPDVVIITQVAGIISCRKAMPTIIVRNPPIL